MAVEEVYGYIYKISNLVNGKCYIGQTKTPKKRWEYHKWAVRKIAKHPLYYSIKKYGVENFEFHILFSCDCKFQLDEAERRVIAAHRSADRAYGYNLELGGGGPGIVSEETKQKIRAARAKQVKTRKGVPCSKETKELLRKANKGKIPPNKGVPMSEEQKKKLSDSKKGQIAWNKGIPCSEEQKKKQSEKMKGRRKGVQVSDETREKISKANKGKVRSEKFKQQVRDRWEQKRIEKLNNKEEL